jgi:hypothetical protein
VERSYQTSHGWRPVTPRPHVSRPIASRRGRMLMIPDSGFLEISNELAVELRKRLLKTLPLPQCCLLKTSSRLTAGLSKNLHLHGASFWSRITCIVASPLGACIHHLVVRHAERIVISSSGGLLHRDIMNPSNDKRRPTALEFALSRSSSTESSSTTSSLKHPRTPRFAEATTVHSPIDGRGPFANDEESQLAQPQPADIGFGYISKGAPNRESAAVPMTPKTPLKSAMRVPGTPAKKFDNPLSPTFREEDILEKREQHTEKEQARDVVRVHLLPGH